MNDQNITVSSKDMQAMDSKKNDMVAKVLIARAPKTRRLTQLAKRVGKSDVSVLLHGPSGVGKEVFARYIHANSIRSEKPFVAINCAAIPENMLEAMLFGYEKGAFTGAAASHPGKFEQAQGGTLLLDEISEMDLGLQAKLLRVLQEREIERIGGRHTIDLDVRVIATTNRNLREEVAAGRFREDLFYRLNVFPLYIPALKDRREDIIPLAEFLLEKHCEATDEIPPVLNEDAKQLLLQHNWPGNIRELENLIQRAMVITNGQEICREDLHLDSEPVTANEVAFTESESSHLGDQLKVQEQQLILDALCNGGGSKKEAAARLGISPRTLRYKIARLREEGININEMLSHRLASTNH